MSGLTPEQEARIKEIVENRNRLIEQLMKRAEGGHGFKLDREQVRTIAAFIQVLNADNMRLSQGLQQAEFLLDEAHKEIAENERKSARLWRPKGK